MPHPFLTARWTNLCIVSYRVPRGLLEPHLPRGLQLDTPPGTPAEMGVVSLVAFDFLDTRVRGVRWPGHVNFPEINLRFYARLPGAGGEEDRRGVVFIRELVPRRLIAAMARALYNEPYVAVPMRCTVGRQGARLIVEHRVITARGRASVIRITAASQATVPPPTSVEHWFKEHQWGFGRDRAGEAMVYEVRHPVWAVHPVERLDLDFDWVGLYGRDWERLATTQPVSVVLAEGSRIEVHPKRTLKGIRAPGAIDPPRA